MINIVAILGLHHCFESDIRCIAGLGKLLVMIN